MRSDLPAHCSQNFLYTFVEMVVDHWKMGKMWTSMCFVDPSKSVFRHFNFPNEMMTTAMKILFKHCHDNEAYVHTAD